MGNGVVKLSLWLSKHYVLRMYGGVEIQFHAFLTWRLVGFILGPFTREKSHPEPIVRHRAGLDVVAKSFCPRRESKAFCPIVVTQLYHLSITGPRENPLRVCCTLCPKRLK
jgi:hypothetical protein